MSASNWQIAVGSLSHSDTPLKVTTGMPRPSGGENFCRVAHSLTNAAGAVASYITQVGFAPMTSGCDASSALVRYPSGGDTDWSCFVFNSLAGTSVNDTCYMLGLTDSSPSRIALRKGALVVGLPDEEPMGASGILAIGTVPVPIGQWVHLRLEVVVQPFGDVYLNCYQNDLALHSVQAPIWEPIPGMELDFMGLAVSFIDDGLGINTGSLPYVGGRAGIGVRVDDVTRRAGFDHQRIKRQTAP